MGKSTISYWNTLDSEARDRWSAGAGAERMLGYFAGEPIDASEREFTMVTLWRDLDALKAFCGDDWSNPVVTEDEEPLVEAMFADHYLRFDQ